MNKDLRHCKTCGMPNFDGAQFSLIERALSYMLKNDQQILLEIKNSDSALNKMYRQVKAGETFEQEIRNIKYLLGDDIYE